MNDFILNDADILHFNREEKYRKEKQIAYYQAKFDSGQIPVTKIDPETGIPKIIGWTKEAIAHGST